MLYELFAHGTDKFKGTQIYDLWPEEKGRTYPVIRLSFSTMQCMDASEFEKVLKENIATAFTTAGFPEAQSFDQNELLSVFLGNFDVIAEQHWLVFLIDDWDYPLLVLAIFLVLTARSSNAKAQPSSAQLIRHRAAIHIARLGSNNPPYHLYPKCQTTVSPPTFAHHAATFQQP